MFKITSANKRIYMHTCYTYVYVHVKTYTHAHTRYLVSEHTALLFCRDENLFNKMFLPVKKSETCSIIHF